jgi:integrase
MIPLVEFLETYRIYREIRPSTFDQYRWCVQCFERHLGRAARLQDLTPDNVNRWLTSLRDRLSPHTAKSRRMTLLSVWNLAAQMQLAESPRLIRTVKIPQHTPEVLTPDQIRRLVDATEGLTGRYCGYRWPDLLRTWILTVAETALRPGDMLALDWAKIRRAGGSLTIVQRKTGRPRSVSLPGYIVSDVAGWHAASGPIWPARSRSVYGNRITALGRSVGIPVTHTALRKTAITDVERQRPGTAWLFAGHASPSTTQQWYISPVSAYKDIPRPQLWRPE